MDGDIAAGNAVGDESFEHGLVSLISIFHATAGRRLVSERAMPWLGAPECNHGIHRYNFGG
jgi:hypothetical protein